MAKANILKPLLEKMRYSIHEFEKEIGVKRSRLDNAIRRNSDLNSEIINLIVAKFPTISRNYLLTEEGEMFITNTNKIPQSQVQKDKNQSLDLHVDDYRNAFRTLLPTPDHRNSWIPSYPSVSFIKDNYPAIVNDLQEGGENILIMTEDKPGQLYRIPDTVVNNQTIMVTVREENCSPEYKPGENILITKIDIEDIDFGRSYYVVFKSKSERIYVVEKIEGDLITLSNSNPDERYMGKKTIKIDKIDMIFVITYGLRKKIQ